jgi:hypothetical protein
MSKISGNDVKPSHLDVTDTFAAVWARISHVGFDSYTPRPGTLVETGRAWWKLTNFEFSPIPCNLTRRGLRGLLDTTA